MKLAQISFLFVGLAIAAVLAATLIAGGLRQRKAAAEFGDVERVKGLRTFDATKRRGYKGLLGVVTVLAAFFAAARPQYGKGTRLIPATNLDVVVVLDFSRSMYAQDIEPSRIFRAKVEIARLVRQLRGARFGAVAFAGEPMGFPLTADGAAVAQFLRQLSPNDMPVGGTAIARALKYARNLLNRDPKSSDHKRVIVLITDGEDLEGSPAEVAKNIGAEGTTIHVVQIGRRTPTRIPDIDEGGRVVGWRRGRNGKPLLTSLSEEGERVLQTVATSTPGGQIIRSEEGTTGIDKITEALKRNMKGELSERVESVYSDIYYYPLGLALLLMLLEALISEAPRRQFPGKRAPAHLKLPRRRPKLRPKKGKLIDREVSSV